MPREHTMEETDSSFLCNFATDVHFPETVQIVEGYDSQYEDLSWSQGEIVHFHSLKDLTRVIARDEGGKHYAIPLTYPESIFEIIPNGSRDKYETVLELIAASPKYVRSLRDIPESTVTKGDILKVVDASQNYGSRKQLKCRIVGKPCTIFLPGSEFGPFETLEDANPSTIRDVFSRHSVPVRVRVQSGKTKALDRTNKTPPAKFEGLFFLEQVARQKTFIVSTMNGGQLRVTKLPIDLEITVRREKSKPEPKLFSRICHLIETEVDINSTITSGSSGGAAWYFDVHEEIENPVASRDDDHMYEELRPPVPPRSPGSNLKQDKISDVDTRYAPSPKPRPLKKASAPVVAPTEMKQVPPPVAHKPNVVIPKQQEQGPSPRSSPRKQKSLSGMTVQAAPQTNSESNIEKIKDSVVDQRTYEVLKQIPPKDRNRARKGSKSLEEKVADQTEVNYGAVVTEPRTVSEQPNPKEALSSDPQSIDTSQDHQMTGGEFRKRLQGMSVSKVIEYLRKLGLSEYVAVFDQESIDGTMLMEMDDEMMQCIGIKNLFHRKKLLMFIQQGYIPNR